MYLQNVFEPVYIQKYFQVISLESEQTLGIIIYLFSLKTHINTLHTCRYCNRAYFKLFCHQNILITNNFGVCVSVLLSLIKLLNFSFTLNAL